MPTTFFSHKEVAEALAKSAGLTTGRFALVAEFQTIIMNAVTERGSGPAALSVVSRLGIEPATAETAEHLVADLGQAEQPTGAIASDQAAETARADEQTK